MAVAAIAIVVAATATAAATAAAITTAAIPLPAADLRFFIRKAGKRAFVLFSSTAS